MSISKSSPALDRFFTDTTPHGIVDFQPSLEAGVSAPNVYRAIDYTLHFANWSLMMKYDFESDWQLVSVSEVTRAGSIFVANVGECDALCMWVVELDNRDEYIVVLDHRGKDEDWEKFSPPRSLSSGALTGNYVMMLKVEKITILPKFNGFPSAEYINPKHRDIMIDKDGRMFLAYDDYPLGRQKVRGYLHLESGGCVRSKPIAAVYSHWRMGVVEDGEMKRVILDYTTQSLAT